MSKVVESNVINKLAITGWTKIFLEMMSKIKYGSIRLHTPEGEVLNFVGTNPGEHVSININSWKFCDDLFLKGDIGLGESYIAGHWDSDNINGLIKFGIANKVELERVIKGSFLKIIFYRIKHLLNRNSKSGSQKNIHAHYDLGNSFYKLWLDKSMTYSSALFENENQDLFEAQQNKYEKIFNKLGVKAGDHILEVGCGWGGFMEYAAKKGVQVTGITISQEQYDFAIERLKPFENLVRPVMLDYRDIKGQYDHIVSIEMFEALGIEYWDKYFSILNAALKPNGKLIIQSITINDADFKSYKKGTDFIQQYVFPGGMLPSPSEFRKISIKQGFKMDDRLEFGLDYGKTLNLWEASFNLHLNKVREIGFDESFIRTWRFYLKYCQGAFEAKKISVSQFYLSK